MVGRALRVAETVLARTARTDVERRGYWCGSLAALRWALGQAAISPITDRPRRVTLETGRAVVADEAEYAHLCITAGHRLPAHVNTMGYLIGVEHTLYWVAHGTGFATSLNTEALLLDGIPVE
jgi:hypothetical protein